MNHLGRAIPGITNIRIPSLVYIANNLKLLARISPSDKVETTFSKLIKFDISHLYLFKEPQDPRGVIEEEMIDSIYQFDLLVFDNKNVEKKNRIVISDVIKQISEKQDVSITAIGMRNGTHDT